MKIKFLFKVVRNESRADVETDFKKTILSMFHRYSTRSRNFVGIIGGWTRNRRNLQIRSTTFSLIPNYRRNVTSVRIYTHTHTHKHTDGYRSPSISHWTRPYFKEEKQFRESSLRSVKNEVERKTSATEMSLSDAINDSCETRWMLLSREFRMFSHVGQLR